MATVEEKSRTTTEIETIPLLEQGDHLTRDEFERRYMAMPRVRKAELIEGKVYMPSPVSLDEHADPHANLVTWLGYYCWRTPGLQVADNATVRLDWLNEPQPDVLLRVRPSFGGQSRDDHKYIGGPPELIAEVAASSASYDLHEKLTVYRRNGVLEYIIWRTRDNSLDWFILRRGEYEKLAPDADGILKSERYPGLWLDPKALLAGDMIRIDAVLQLGLASPEHAAFVEKLRAASS